MLVFSAIKIFKELPEKWVLCITALVLPLSIGVGSKLAQKEGSINLSHGETQFNLGRIKESAAHGEKALQALQSNHFELQRAVEELRDELATYQIQELESLKQIENAISENNQVVDTVAESQEGLGELAEEVMSKAVEEVE